MIGYLLGYTYGKVLSFDEGIKVWFTDGKVICTILGNVDLITLGLDIGTDLGFLDWPLDGYNDGKLEALLTLDSI